MANDAATQLATEIRERCVFWLGRHKEDPANAGPEAAAFFLKNDNFPNDLEFLLALSTAALNGGS